MIGDPDFDYLKGEVMALKLALKMAISGFKVTEEGRKGIRSYINVLDAAVEKTAFDLRKDEALHGDAFHGFKDCLDEIRESLEDALRDK